MGSAKDKLDSRGAEKVQCRVCELWFHDVGKHVVGEHKYNCTDDYVSEHPDALLLSEKASKKKTQTEDDPDLFKFGVARLREREDLEEDELIYVPTHDESWELGSDEKEFLESLALGIEEDDNVLIVGPPGVGKSTLVKELAAACNQPLRRLAFRGDMRASDLIGKPSLIVDQGSGQSITSYENGVLPDAAERGHWMLVDELDAGPPQVMFLLHPVLEQPHRTLMLTAKDGGHNVNFDPGFRFICTANTLGYGDESGLYAGTGPQNEALLDRFGVVINMGYPTKENEIDRLQKKTKVDKDTAEKMVEVATKVREAQRNDSTMTSLSPRRLLGWAQKTVRLNDARKASRITVTNKLPKEDRDFVDSLIQRHFGGSV